MFRSARRRGGRSCIYPDFAVPVSRSAVARGRPREGASDMALAISAIEEPSMLASVERPIDLVHLARMTLGDRGLEREVLQLFDRQATMLVARMQASAPDEIAA